jgi:diguanylate cyclase (GGDEF)-like protein/PAS domain S-box-containing protein
MSDVAFRFVLTEPPLLESARGDVTALLGYSADDFLAQTALFREHTHPGDHALADSLFSSDTQSPSGALRIRLRHADGKIRCICGHFKKERRVDGEVTLELHLADARTVKEPHDAALVRSFKSLIQRSSDFIYLKNRSHVILATSQTMPSLAVSSSSDNLVGTTDYENHPEEIADVYYALEETAFTEGRRTNLIHEVSLRDGTKCWIDNRKYPINGPDGEIIGIFGVVPEITEFKEAQKRLIESEESLREAQAIAGLGSYVLDIPKMVWQVSPEVAQLLGIDDDYGRGFDRIWPLIYPDDRPALEERFKQHFAGSLKWFDNEYRILRHTDGALRWMHTRGKLECDAQGKPQALRGTIQDITGHKLAEGALRESKNLLQLFIEHAPVALAMLDLKMHYIAVSQRWIEMHGLSGRELIGRSHYEIFPNLPQSWKNYHQRALAGETVETDEDALIRPDGREQWLRRMLRPWFDADGRIAGIILFSEDVTERRRAEVEVRESKEMLQLFIEHAPAALAMFDRDMRYVAASRRWIKNFRLGGKEIIGRPHYEIFPDLPERWKEAHQRGLAGEVVRNEDDRFDRADGTTQWVRWELMPWRTGDGSVGGIIISSEDISTQKETENRLRLSASVFTGAREGIIITDGSGTILEVNEAFTRITGYSREEAIGRSPRMLKSGLQSREFYENMWNTLQRDGHWSGEIWNRTKSGDIYPETLSINALLDENGRTLHYVALFSDISEIKEREQQLEHIAHFDALTGLPNRTLFADRLRQAMGQAHRSKRALAVAHFDLDGFKAINDRYGHSVGDGLLTAMAFRMKRALREGDTLARLGGDEFAAVMMELDDEESVTPALNRLLEAASEEAQIGDILLRVSASAGVTFYPQTEDVDADVLLRQAGQAMYQAKLAGGNRYLEFDTGQDLIARSRHENLEQIRHAMAANQFVLHYQPKVNMRTGKVVGAEALIRWQHPERGLLPPSMFLPVIEDHPLSIELGKWGFETVLRQMEEWQAKGLELFVSTNVSAIELQQPDFTDQLRAYLAAHPAIKPSSLVLEVVETTALQDVMQTSHVLNTCRDIGVSVALDDFGIGYSSLTYLRRLPANILKIDQSFVRDMLEEPENLTILEGVIGLASAFRRDVIAEGVETVDHGLMLLQMGCEIAQGYGIAKAMPPDELFVWATSWRPDPRWAEVPQVHASNRPVLYACVEHRAWLSAFEACLQGRRTAPPSLDANDCRMGAWLNAEKQSARGTLSSVQAIENLHRELHGLAAEIFASQSEGRNSEGLSRLQQLHYLHDKCLARLRNFTRDSRGRSNGRNSARTPVRSRSKRS